MYIEESKKLSEKRLLLPPPFHFLSFVYTVVALRSAILLFLNIVILGKISITVQFFIPKFACFCEFKLKFTFSSIIYMYKEKEEYT